uniref:Uncharacterized protein n=2 Tax=Parascaris univalens TaxID=6257 RepID=A0A914ZTY6_PARUN
MHYGVVSVIWLSWILGLHIVDAERCLSCATKEAVTNWNKFMKYRLLDSRTGTLLDEHPCENPSYVTCENPCYIFQITGKLRSGEDNQLFALAQGCSSGLFDEIPSDYKCIDRDIPMRGRGGYFTLKAKYCFCWGDMCTEYNEIWMKHNPNPNLISIPHQRPNEMQPIASDYSLTQRNYAYHAAATSSSAIDPITLTYHVVIIVSLGYLFV